MPSSSANKPPRKSRTRTFSGCMTCRNRKVKCDVQKPTCGNCNRLGLSCRGYDTAIHWLPSWDPVATTGRASSPPPGGRMRTELLSVDSQHDMLLGGMFEPGCHAEDISSQLDRVLADVDTHAHDATGGNADQDGWQHIQGPFGVFSAVQSKESSPRPHHLPWQRPEESEQQRLDGWDDIYTFSPSLVDDAVPFACDDSISTESLEIMFATAQPVSAPWVDTHEVLVPQVVQQNHDCPLPASSIWDSISSDYIEPAGLRISHAERMPSPLLSSISSPELVRHDSPYLPRCAQYLLWHYSNHTIASLSGIPHSQEKSVWRQLHLPTALQAYAELGVLGDSSLPRVSLLYSLMSIACFQLQALHKGNLSSPTSRPTCTTSSEPQNWGVSDYEAQASKFRDIAQKGMEKFLKSAEWSAGKAGGRGGNNFKCKEVLVAAISLVCIRIVSGETDDTRQYVQQCEDIIQGMNQAGDHKTSRKITALRRMLLYIQVMESASSPCPDPSHPERAILLAPNGQEPDSAGISAVAVAASISTPSVHALIACTNEESTAQSSLRDIPDLKPGAEEDTGVNEDDHATYGVPASLLYLLSRTTKLIGDMEHLPITQSQSAHTLFNLAERTSSLENEICTWPNRNKQDNQRRKNSGVSQQRLTDQPGLGMNKSSDNIDSRDDQVPVPLHRRRVPQDFSADEIALQMQGCLSRALHGAILIYFFRSARKTHPAILQHYVSNVISELETHASLKAAFAPSRLNAIVWPSFIATCEAIDDGLRRRGIACLRQAAWAGFGNWKLAEPVAYEVWKRRDGGDFGVSWQDVVRGMPVKMVLT